MKLANAQRIIAFFLLTALAKVSAGCGKEETFVVVTTQLPVEEPETIEDALYAGDEEPEPPCEEESEEGGGERRGLRKSQGSGSSSSSTGTAPVDRELGNDCPYICCWLCQGWPAGQCFIWSWTFTCRGWKPEKCKRRELEEKDFDLEEEVTRHHRLLKAQPAVDNQECKKIVDDEQKKMKKSHILYSDWNAMERSKFDCVTAVPQCEEDGKEEKVKKEKEVEVKEEKVKKEKEVKMKEEKEDKEQEEKDVEQKETEEDDMGV